MPEAAATWESWYRADLQGIYALLLAPALFLVYLLVWGRRGAGDGARRFVFLYCLVFTVETLLDPISTGLLVRSAPPGVAAAVSLLFVLLGDFRVFLLVFSCSGQFEARRGFWLAVAWTPVVAVLGFAIDAALDVLVGPLSGQVLWLCHELLFTALAFALLGRFGGDPFVRCCLLFVAAYYGLWAAADVSILMDLDEGWLLRALPNQLYYALWTPFVWLSARQSPPSGLRYAASSSSVQASR